MKNSIEDLNNHLFEAIEKLSEPNLKGKDLLEEINRGKTIAMISKEIINGGQLTLNAIKINNHDSTDELILTGVLAKKKLIPPVRK